MVWIWVAPLPFFVSRGLEAREIEEPQKNVFSIIIFVWKLVKKTQEMNTNKQPAAATTENTLYITNTIFRSGDAPCRKTTLPGIYIIYTAVPRILYRR